MVTDLAETAAQIQRLVQAVNNVMVGKTGVIERAVIALLAQGHLLLEDVPGLGKTLLARALAHALGLSFRRIQFTPDLLPSEVTGTTVYAPAQGTFSFQPGPLFASVVLADEINRATPRTQSALLQAMEEGAVSVGGVDYPLPEPFLVLATQNPVEMEGTFPLPEAQLDRFLLRLALGYPEWHEEQEIVARHLARVHPDLPAPVVTREQVLAWQRARAHVHVGEAVRDYALALVRATRSHPSLRMGASPRATLALLRAAQGRALLHGRGYVLPDDVQDLAVDALAHRVLLAPEPEWEGQRAADVVAEAIRSVPVPVEEVDPRG